MKRLGFAGLVLIVLLFAAQAVSAQEGWPGCPWGYGFNPMIHGDVLECLNRPPATTAAASKPAGLAALAPAQERFVPCSFGEGVDPLLDPLALACLTQPDTGAKAASKPAGLAAPAAVAIPEQNLSCEGWGDAAYSVWADAAYNPMLYGYVPECVSRPAASESIALKAAGLAAPTPAVVIPEQDGPGCTPGYYYYIVGSGDQGDCFPESIWSASATATVAASKPAGLAAPAPAPERFVPCSFGEGVDPLLDPLALACLR